MNKQSTKPIFIETFGMWNWSQMLLVDGLRQGWVGFWWGGKTGGCLLKALEVAAFAEWRVSLRM